MENMVWEHHLTATGVMTVSTVKPEFQPQFAQAKARMKELLGKVVAEFPEPEPDTGRCRERNSSHYDAFGEFQFSYRYGDIQTPYLENQEPLTVECRHFLDCIRNGEEPRSGGEDGLNVVRVIAAAQESTGVTPA